MWCYIYRSPKKENCYLYIEKENDFSSVPETVLTVFGKPILAMRLLLTPQRKLVVGSVDEVKEKIAEQGFFLQMLNDDDFKIK